MEYKITFRPLTEISNLYIKKQNPHLNSAEEFQEIIINAETESHALNIFVTMVQHSGMKIAQYRVEPAYPNNDAK